MAVSERHAFIVIAFPVASRTGMTDTERMVELAPEAKRLREALERACGEPAQPLQPNLTAVCLLAHGQHDRIVRAVEEARSGDTAAFIARVDTPTECIGLSVAESWLKRKGVA